MVSQKTITRLRLIVAGVFLGLITTILFQLSYLDLPQSFRIIISSGSIFGLMITSSILWYTSKIQKATHKARLLFFGISLTAFTTAFIDLGSYFIYSRTNIGGASIQISQTDLYFGGISFFSVLTNFVIGGLFTVLERFIDLEEKGDL